MTGPAPAVVSAHNDRVVAARRLRQRKERTARGAFLVEGPNAVGHALASGRHRVRELFITADAADREPALLAAAKQAGVRTTVATAAVLATLSDTLHPQGVVAVAEINRVAFDEVLAAEPRLIAVLVAVGDPGNAGTVIRTADAMGADAVVLTTGSADPYSGKVVRASAGCVLTVPLVTDLEPAAVLAGARGRGLRSFATALDGDPLDAIADLDRPVAWLFGNEAHGLPADVAASADRRVRIPMYGGAESLNLAAAAAICLHATAAAQRR